ncbi:MAG: LptA/OstA family protein [Candidatus Sericytochromatia bacterium]|nr:LptA/OstA family protein [Candidatus Sericytochromatia bacterium]
MADRPLNRTGWALTATVLAWLGFAPQQVAAQSAIGPDAQRSPEPVRPIVPGTPAPGVPESSPTPEGPRVKVRGDTLSFDRQKGLTRFRGNVHVEYGATLIDSEELSVDAKAKVVFTDARFTLVQPDPKDATRRQVITGTGLRYNYETQEADVKSANVAAPAEFAGQTVHIRAKDLHGSGQSRWEASHAVFSTCAELADEQVPHYHVEARLIQYEAGEKIVSWDNRVYLNGRYTFWLPVWVIPLKREQNDLNIGRSEVEGFYLRSAYAYTLPSLNQGYWLNSGRLTANLFEKKPVGLGVEHTATWGYDGATYAFFYGLLTPDRSNFLPPTQTLGEAEAERAIRQGYALFGLNGQPFQDRQWGIEHKQRLFGDVELDGRFEDHNIYDPMSHNFRVNRQSSRVSLKDRLEGLGLNYDVGYDGTRQRGNQSNTDKLSQSHSDRARGNMSFSVLNTDFRLSSQFDRNQQVNRSVKAVTPEGGEALPAGAIPTFEVKDEPGVANTNITNALNASSRLGEGTNATLNVPYRVQFRESPPPTASPAPNTPVATPSPWDQQAEPQLDLTHKLKGIGTLQVQAQKFLDLTQEAPTVTPVTAPSLTPTQATSQAEEQIRRYGKFDKLPELTLTADPFLSEWQPVTMRVGYGRYFEYASFKLPAGRVGQPLDKNFPGDYINRFNPEISLGSKSHDIGLNSKLDFGGTGYRQFFYSTRDAQYSIDQRLRLTTQFGEGVSSNLNYTNNITPDVAEQFAKGLDKYVNNSPFNLDRLSLSKQTRLTGSLDAARDPWFRFAFRGGYDYINKLYDNLSSELTWRTAPFGLPLGLSLNGQYDIQENEEGGLKFEHKTLDMPWLPKLPTYGIAGKWLPMQGTLTLRSTPEIFGGAYGADKIEPGWQIDSQLAYDFDKGLWQSLVNRLYMTFGNHWTNHVQFVLGGYYDLTEKQYKFSQIGITKDLHDFVLTAQYDRLASFYSVSLTMLAFPSQPLNFTSNTFDRRSGAGGAAFGAMPSLPGF